jgi:hypothetical protein
MQKKSFMKFLLPGFGYLVMGNICSTIMTFSLYNFAATDTMFMGFLAVLTMAVYLLMVAVPAYKDGMEENSRVRNKRCELSDIPKHRWLLIGAVLYAVMMLPTIGYLLFSLNEGVYRIVNGAVSPLSWIWLEGTGNFREGPQGEQIELTRLQAFVPYVYMGLYALTIPAVHLGFILGLGDKMNKDKIMYK